MANAGPGMQWRDQGNNASGGRYRDRDDTPASEDLTEQWWGDWQKVSNDLIAVQDLALGQRSRGAPVPPATKAEMRLLRNTRFLVAGIIAGPIDGDQSMRRILETVRVDHQQMCDFSGHFTDLFRPALGRILLRVIDTATDSTRINPPSDLPEDVRRAQLEGEMSLAETLAENVGDHIYLRCIERHFTCAYRWYEVLSQDGNSIVNAPEAADFASLLREAIDAEDFCALPAAFQGNKDRQVIRLRLRSLFLQMHEGGLDHLNASVPRLVDLVRRLVQTDMGNRGYATDGSADYAYLERLDRGIANYGDDSV